MDDFLDDLPGLDDAPSENFPALEEHRPLIPTNIKPSMIQRIAVGLDDPYEVAAEYGIDAQTLDRLTEQDWFANDLTARRDALKADGFHLRYKATQMFEVLMQRVYETANTSETNLADQLSTLKYFGEVAGVKPKEDKVQGSGFQVNITIGAPDPDAPDLSRANGVTQVVEVEDLEVAEKVEEFQIMLSDVGEGFGYASNDDLWGGMDNIDDC